MPPSEDHERAEEFTALAELAEVFLALVAALGHGDPVTLSPRRIVEIAAHCMPRSEHAALAVAQDGHVHNVAATSDVPAQVDRIRDATGQGPALDVLDTNDLVLSGDLTTDPRWPLFADRVTHDTSIRSTVSYRLYISSRHRAALSFYSTWPYAFDDLAVATGAIFAAYASLTLTSELVLTEPVPPRRSADVHREIGVAIGILMSTANLSSEIAYQRLHQASQQLKRSLPTVARHVVEHRRLPGSHG